MLFSDWIQCSMDVVLIGKTATSSETFSIISQVYTRFRLFRSEPIEKRHSTHRSIESNHMFSILKKTKLK
jgi:hypothetical protein